MRRDVLLWAARGSTREPIPKERLRQRCLIEMASRPDDCRLMAQAHRQANEARALT